MSGQNLRNIGIACLVIAILIMQIPAGPVDSALPPSAALLAGMGRISLSLGHTVLALGSALLGAGLVIQHLDNHQPSHHDESEDDDWDEEQNQVWAPGSH